MQIIITVKFEFNPKRNPPRYPQSQFEILLQNPSFGKLETFCFIHSFNSINTS